MNVLGIPMSFLDKQEKMFLSKTFVETPFVSKKYIDTKHGVVPKHTYSWYKIHNFNYEELTVLVLKYSEKIKIHRNVTYVESINYIRSEISDAIFDRALDGMRTLSTMEDSYNFNLLIKTNDLTEILDYNPEFRNHITIYD